MIALARTPQLTDGDIQMARGWFHSLLAPIAGESPTPPCPDGVEPQVPAMPTAATGSDLQSDGPLELPAGRRVDRATWAGLATQMSDSDSGAVLSALAALILGQPEQADAALAKVPPAQLQLVQMQVVRLELAALRGQTDEVQAQATALLVKDPFLLPAHWQLAKATAKTDVFKAIKYLRDYRETVQRQPPLSWQTQVIDGHLLELEVLAENDGGSPASADSGEPPLAVKHRVDLGLTLAPIAALAAILLLPIALFWLRQRGNKAHGQPGPRS